MNAARFAEARRVDLKIGAQLALEVDCVYLCPTTTGKFAPGKVGPP